MHAADVENPNPNPGPGGGDMFAVKPEPDVKSQFCSACCLACMEFTLLTVSAGLVLLFCRYTLRAHAAVVVRILAAAGLVVGVLGIVFGTLCCCPLVAAACINGNVEGRRQGELPRVAA